MGQVIVTVGRLNVGAPGGTAQLLEPNGARSDELSTSGTAASASAAIAASGEYALVTNNSAGLVWVRFNGTAAVEAGCPVLPNAVMAFGPLAAGAVASVIDDS